MTVGSNSLSNDLLSAGELLLLLLLAASDDLHFGSLGLGNEEVDEETNKNDGECDELRGGGESAKLDRRRR